MREYEYFEYGNQTYDSDAFMDVQRWSKKITDNLKRDLNDLYANINSIKSEVNKNINATKQLSAVIDSFKSELDKMQTDFNSIEKVTGNKENISKYLPIIISIINTILIVYLFIR